MALPDPSNDDHALRRYVYTRIQARMMRAEEVIDDIAATMDRASLNAPEDEHVASLCATYGYGAVMDAAARLWARTDPIGALTTGPCRGTIASVIASRKEGRP
jgi:hypothetical protein